MAKNDEPAALLPDPKLRADLTKEFNLRRKEHIEKRIVLADLKAMEEEGWSVVRTWIRP